MRLTTLQMPLAHTQAGDDSGNNESQKRKGDQLNGTTTVEWHSNVFETSIMALKILKKWRLKRCE